YSIGVIRRRIDWARRWVGGMRNAFFFSSRRRHTRSKRDWSSDVCSSDLDAAFAVAFVLRGQEMAVERDEVERRADPDDRRNHVRSEERRVGKECRSRGGPYD